MTTQTPIQTAADVRERLQLLYVERELAWYHRATVFGTQAAIALLEGDERVLPIAPIAAHHERMVRAKEVYYETGAVLAHSVRPAPFL